MQTVEKNDDNILIVASPIEFVLIGTSNNKRAVLAKSNHSGIDLLSSQIKESLDDSLVNKLLYKVEEKPLMVESIYIKKSGMDRYDNIEFVWRGLATRQNIEVLEEILNNYAAQMYVDINKKNQKSELEWMVAELVYCANKFKSRRYYKLIQRNFAFYSFLVIYLVIILYVFFFKFSNLVFT